MKKMLEKVKKITAITMVFALALGIIGCGNGDAKTAAQSGQENSPEQSTEAKTEAPESEKEAVDAKEFQVVRIATTGTEGASALTDSTLIAYKLGYLEEELNKAGYTAEYFGFGQGGPAVNEAIAAGEVDVTFYAEFPLITAASNGIDLTAFALTNSEVNYALLAGPDSGITSADDLNGKSVVLGIGTILQRYFINLVKAHSLDESTIGQLNSLADAQTLIASGDADATITALQGALMYQTMGLGTVVATTIEEPESRAGMVAVADSAWLGENEDAAIAIIRAMERAKEYAQADPQAAYEAMASERSPASVYEATYSYDESFSYFDPSITDEYLVQAQSIADFMYENGLIKSEVDVHTVYDNSYVEKALAE